MMKAFALVDCDNFYISCERVFNPSYNNRPVVVLSNNDDCIVSRSDEVKKMGIPGGAAIYKFKDILKKNNVSIFSSNYTLYGDMSRRVMETLSQFTDDLEVYSIDEAFLSLDGLTHVNLDAYARTIKKTVEQWTGIPVTIGLAATKTLAKAANRLAKKNPEFNGVCNLCSHLQIDELLKIIPVGKVWGIGWQSEKKLSAYGITNAYELKIANADWMKKKFGVIGQKTVLELRGESCLPVEQIPSKKQVISYSKSFGRAVKSIDELNEALADYISAAAVKLRKQKSAATYLYIYLMTKRFEDKSKRYYNSIQIVFETPTANTLDLINYAIKNLEKIYMPGYDYRKVGIVFAGLIPDGQIQFNIFENKSGAENMQRLMNALDSINAKHGTQAIQVASAGINKTWQMRREMKSPHYTTRWNELPVVKV